MNTSNFTVAPSVAMLLPDVLIDYLWQLALAEDYRTCEEQTFNLNPMELGSWTIQEICHGEDLRRVFGMEPVSCTLRVYHLDDSYQMALAG